MRILHLVHSEGVYGAELMLLHLARRQAEAGWQPIIGSIGDPGVKQKPVEELAQRWGLQVMPIRVPARPTPSAISAVIGGARRERISLIHTHGYKGNVLVGLVPRSSRPPVVATVHGWTAGGTFGWLALYEWLDRRMLTRMESVVLVSKRMADLPDLKRARIQTPAIIENGLPSREIRLALHDAAASCLDASLLRFMQARPTVACIGRLSVEKGQDVLIKALKILDERGIAMNLLLAGEGPQRSDLEELSKRLGLADRVCMPGYIPMPDRVLADSICFALPSHTEGLPLTLLEAMQWRVPIVASSVGGIPDALEQGRAGLLVGAGDSLALADAMERLFLDAGLRDRLTETAYELVTHRFSDERMAAEYALVYERACRSRGQEFDNVTQPEH